MTAKNTKQGKASYFSKKQLWIALGILLPTLLIIALFTTDYPKKIIRALRPYPAPQRVESITEDPNLLLQIEEKLRAEYDEKLKQELAAIQESKTQESEEQKPLPKLPLGTVSDVRKLRSEILFESKVNALEGATAQQERKSKDSYKASYELTIKLPKAATTLSELESINPELSKILPSLPALLDTAKISPWFGTIYTNKVERIRSEAHSLSELLTKHNLYDCETILHLVSDKGRKVFLMQAEMDVVSDGSDGDRLPQMPDEIVNSTHYQPFTSYGWPKQTKTANPMIAGLKKRIEGGLEELNAADTKSERKKWLKDRIALLKRFVSDLEARSYLIAEYDPFIVIPVNLLKATADSHTPKIGDYAAVIYENKVYPCIVGDGGPTFKVGEASLRLAKEINSNASPYSRPVSDLKVTYLVFPGSREKKAQVPDYIKWRQKCFNLLEEIGGLGSGYELHEWIDLFPKPDPSPTISAPLLLSEDKAIEQPALEQTPKN